MKTKKELKIEYKQHKPVMGVFQVRNKNNGKILIEGSIDVHSKWNRHRTELRFGSHRNAKLQKDWNQFKSEDFVFEILSELDYEEDKVINYRKEVKQLEQMIIEEMGLFDALKY